MRKIEPLEYRGFKIKLLTDGGSTHNDLRIVYPNGKRSDILVMNVKAAKRIIDTYLRRTSTIFWDAIEVAITGNGFFTKESKMNTR